MDAPEHVRKDDMVLTARVWRGEALGGISELICARSTTVGELRALVAALSAVPEAAAGAPPPPPLALAKLSQWDSADNPVSLKWRAGSEVCARRNARRFLTAPLAHRRQSTARLSPTRRRWGSGTGARWCTVRTVCCWRRGQGSPRMRRAAAAALAARDGVPLRRAVAPPPPAPRRRRGLSSRLASLPPPPPCLHVYGCACAGASAPDSIRRHGCRARGVCRVYVLERGLRDGVRDVRGPAWMTRARS